MFGEAEFQRREDTAQAAHFLHSRIQELEASLVAQRVTLEQSKQRELALHRTIDSLTNMLDSKQSRLEGLEETIRHLDRTNVNVAQQARSLAEEVDSLRRRLRGGIAFASASDQTSSSSPPLIGLRHLDDGAASRESLFHEAVELRQKLAMKSKEADAVMSALNALIDLPLKSSRLRSVGDRNVVVQRVADMIVEALEARRLSSAEIEEGVLRSLPAFSMRGASVGTSSPDRVKAL